MRICEYEFEREDQNHKGYSFVEVDTYEWIPEGMGIQSHRLSLRKNLNTGMFEVYRHYNIIAVVTRPQVAVQSLIDTKREEVIYAGDLKGALQVTNGEYAKYWGTQNIDVVCDHSTWSCARRQPK
jgi:hypothetical protein